MLQRDLVRVLGSRPGTAITRRDVALVLDLVEARGSRANQARRRITADSRRSSDNPVCIVAQGLYYQPQIAWGSRMATKPPDAFLSYTRFDDQHHRGAISEFRRRLADAVRAVSGEPLEIFQDVDGIGIGEHWPDKLDQMLDQARLFIPIVTPSYFTSKACREELEKFLHAEAERGRNDLVLPIYYIECDVLEDDDLRAADPLASKLHERQRQDWRELRFKRFEAVSVRQDLGRLAREIAKARRTRMPRRADAPISPARVERTPTMRADVASIGVEYDGIRFRSQAEARWAVFFNTVGLKYEYEKGYELDGFRCFSDFWLPELGSGYKSGPLNRRMKRNSCISV